ncbi:DUF3499 domain-containing protein [Nesterenkonia haasae]|uniref:DUF3499 domain-containing protein n=1 Tax=Nesterenkonia haasae TaxID=2587813 RepID=UPI0013910DD6|nr:DUF3499 domain-containing protein [Nesterenkonia haasae]NDK31007.1 DUF3499 domain-containing protein [Nesterenkonia haasae]
MDSKRRCTKHSCAAPAVATLTYSYADSTVVVGPISVYAEPHAYDLCASHADAVRAPRGWELLRLDYSSPEGGEDDLLALADAVREPRRESVAAAPARQAPTPLSAPENSSNVSRGHLRLLPD